MRGSLGQRLLPLWLLSTLPVGVLSGNIIGTDGFTTCISDPSVKVTALNVTYNRSTRIIDFDVAGESTVVQNVSATMVVSAYGRTLYTNTFSPCSYGMTEMCPIPVGTFASSGQQTIPEEYASKIPSIAFSIPDLDGDVKLTLENTETKENVGCVESTVSNGKSLQLAAVTYIAAGIAAAALLFSGASALASGGHPGATTSSPSFTEVIGWFQGIATNGMLSVQYPSVYRSFSSNFGFATGLVPWGDLQTSIDNFRKATGGNLTDSSYQYLKDNVTLVYGDSSNSSSAITRRALDIASMIFSRGTDVAVNDTSVSIGGDSSSNSTSTGKSKEQEFVYGIKAYAEQLSIPQANTFMTVLLIFAIVVGALIVSILLVKVILEAWSMFGKLPKYLESWRRRYWWRLAKAITNLIMMLYSVWTLYCIYQFTNGDSWAAKVLAAVTLAGFTAVLAGFTWRIYTKAQEYKKLDGDAARLYEDKETWIKYSLFYDNFKRDYYMFFVPVIIYMFAKGCVIAGANGHGLIQCAGQLIIEAIMLGLMLWTRPYQLRSGRWINIFIHVVRVLSVVCILVFVEELGISQTTQTITGVALIVVQVTLTASLAVLIAVNSLIVCIRENPHKRQRKEAEKLNRDLDNLTPLDARNSLLMEPMSQQETEYRGGMARVGTFGSDRKGAYDVVPARSESPHYAESNYSRPARVRRNPSDSQDRLVSSAASMGRRNNRSLSRSPPGEARLPDLDFDFGIQR